MGYYILASKNYYLFLDILLGISKNKYSKLFQELHPNESYDIHFLLKKYLSLKPMQKDESNSKLKNKIYFKYLYK